MRPPINAWQGCLDHWQPAFIRENFLPLGYGAWQGYLTHGRGIVVCEVAGVDATTVDWSGDVVPYSIQYIPAAAVCAYLQTYHLADDFSDRLLDIIQTYRPDGEILIAIERGGQIEVSLLRNLAIAPPDCHRQVCNRWDEFHLEPGSDQRCNDTDR